MFQAGILALERKAIFTGDMTMKLRPIFRLLLRGLAPAALLLAFATPRTITAQAADQDHVVSSQALDQQLANSSATRQQNIETLQKLMETPTAQKAMHDAKVDPQQVKSAIPTLSDDELANLSARANNAQHDLAAGYIGPGLFTIIILAVIVIIIIIVIH
jgi:Flp pilus assembly protein TadB